jgi:hypothetical protein
MRTMAGYSRVAQLPDEAGPILSLATKGKDIIVCAENGVYLYDADKAEWNEIQADYPKIPIAVYYANHMAMNDEL